MNSMTYKKESQNARDQRLHRRVEYADPVRLFVARSIKPLDCPAVNISRGGLSVSARRPLLVGRELSLEVKTGTGAVRVESAEVVWTRPLGDKKPSDGAYAWEMGLQFICLTLKNRLLMEKLVDQLTGSGRDQERATGPSRGGGARCGTTFDLERRLLPDPEAKSPRRPVEVVVRSDRLREFRGRLLALAAMMLATAALLSFLVIGMTTPDERSSRRRIEQLQSRLQEAERQVTVLESRLNRLTAAPEKNQVSRPAVLSAAATTGGRALRSIRGGRYFRPVAVVVR